MSRIANRFTELKAAGRKALIPYITAGDPQPGVTVSLMHALVEAGADIVELGVPFSDPMADGPVIQLACERALEHGTTLKHVLAMVAEFRQQDTDTPVVLMGYLNPVEIFGYEAFAKAASEAGVDGLLTVDLPPEEAEAPAALLKQYGIDPIFLLAPTTTEARAATICQYASGFIYYVSIKGVTGAAALNVAEVETKLAGLRKQTKLPIGVGFGIRDATTAKAVGAVADAVIVGSALVQKIADNVDTPDKLPGLLQAVLQPMRAGLDSL